jgi:mandelamide amidase
MNGAINVGKTNMNEFALGTTTYNQFYGTAKNAFDETRIAGGSSGGSGGAVGTGAVSFGLGTDYSGSIRIPASFNGIVGYRPSVNRWPCDFGVKASHIKDTCGPMVQDMEDLTLIDQIVTETRHKDVPALKSLVIAVPKMHF